ncbi:HNH endonuclease family protein [Amycolatopsis sp. NPDC059657]|uniref:HNH endonuclease family protein n=1 Tax=Amycolatopsis sp. NPDC059657 TaxID=3346899 RepID=UPI00366D4188
MRRNIQFVLAGVAAVLAVALVFWLVTANQGTAAAPSANAGDARAQLEQLKVAPRGTLDGYDRKKYPHWSNQGQNCNTREFVLKRDGKDVKAGSDCNPTSGSWTSPYDGDTWTKPSDVDIDHMVPLAQSWVSGAKDWTNEKREQFANDLTRPQLFTVTDRVNQQKSDKAPDQWKPPLVSFWCTYATDWITVKNYYALTITSAEKSALTLMLDKC